MTYIPGLSTKIQEIVEAAIEAEMSSYGYYGTCADGFEGYSRATEELPISDPITVKYPSGAVYQFGSEADWLEPFMDAKALFSKWQEEIPQNFERFDDLPHPDAFDYPLETLAAITTGLSAQGASTSGSGSDTTVSVGNLDLSSYIESAQHTLGNFSGDAMQALNQSYLARLDDVVGGQQVLACVLGVSMAGEQEVWRTTRIDLLDIAEEARKAFKAYANGGGGSVKELLEVAGAAASAIGLFTANPVVKGASTILGIVTKFMPDPPAPPVLQLGGGSVEEIHGNLLEALSTLCQTIADQERALGECASGAATSVMDHLDSYDLGTPSDFLGENRPGELYGPGEEVAVVFDGLRDCAGLVQGVASVLDQIHGDLSSSVGDYRWVRNAQVGLGSHGHYDDWATLHDNLGTVLQRTSTTLTDVAARMVLVANDFQATEDQITQELSQLVAGLNDPTPTETVPYGHP